MMTSFVRSALVAALLTAVVSGSHSSDLQVVSEPIEPFVPAAEHQTLLRKFTVVTHHHQGHQALELEVSVPGTVYLHRLVPATPAPTATATKVVDNQAPEVTTPPLTEAPAATQAPATEAPVTEAPVNETPATEAPVTEAPVTEAPATEAPATEAPATEAPATEAPATEAPATEAPATEAPASEAPVTEAPTTEAPATEAPATEAPATEAPVSEAPATEAPVSEAPATEAPATEAPATEAPATDAPATEAPATEAPTTEAPATEAPAASSSAPVEKVPDTIVSSSETPVALQDVPRALRRLSEVEETFVVARFEFSGDNEELLKLIEVEVAEDNKINVKLGDSDGKDVVGYLFGEVFVFEGVTIASLSAIGAADVVVQEPLLDQDNLNFVAIGAAKLFVSLADQELHLNSLTVSNNGAGSVQIDVPTLAVAHDVELEASGVAKVVIKTKSFAVDGAVSNSVVGSANVVVESSSFKVHDTLSFNVEGAAHVHYSASSSNSQCSLLEGSMAGADFVDFGTIECKNASIRVAGSCTAYVQVVDKLSIHGTAVASSIHYVGDKPHEIETENALMAKIAVTPAEPRVETFSLEAIPPPMVQKVVSHPPSEYDSLLGSLLAPLGSVVKSLSVVGVALALVVVALVLVIMRKHKQRRAQEHHSKNEGRPLLAKEENQGNIYV